MFAAGVDAGTQSIKVVVYDSDEKRIVASSSSPLSLIEGDDGLREQKAEWWLDAVRSCFSALSDDVKKAIRAGFTSVMIDGAALPYEENIKFTKRAVDFAKSYHIPVEAELGAILGKEDDHVSEVDAKTNPDQVRDFVLRSGCHMLAVSIGNVHGLSEQPRIDFDLLEKISFYEENYLLKVKNLSGGLFVGSIVMMMKNEKKSSWHCFLFLNAQKYDIN